MSEKGRKKNPQREGLCREALSPRNILLHAKRVRRNSGGHGLRRLDQHGLTASVSNGMEVQQSG